LELFVDFRARIFDLPRGSTFLNEKTFGFNPERGFDAISDERSDGVGNPGSKRAPLWKVEMGIVPLQIPREAKLGRQGWYRKISPQTPMSPLRDQKMPYRFFVVEKAGAPYVLHRPVLRFDLLDYAAEMQDQSYPPGRLGRGPQLADRV
jgi:hypothetical protein